MGSIFQLVNPHFLQIHAFTFMINGTILTLPSPYVKFVLIYSNISHHLHFHLQFQMYKYQQWAFCQTWYKRSVASISFFIFFLYLQCVPFFPNMVKQMCCKYLYFHHQLYLQCVQFLPNKVKHMCCKYLYFIISCICKVLNSCQIW